MFVAVLQATLSLYASQSLKEKRYVVNSVRDRLRQRFNVALAETGEQDRWGRAELSIVTVAGSRVGCEKTMNAVTNFLDGDGRFELVEREVEFL